eukprot:364684-Chlamydomonas_euryale.AAC.4
MCKSYVPRYDGAIRLNVVERHVYVRRGHPSWAPFMDTFQAVVQGGEPRPPQAITASLHTGVPKLNLLPRPKLDPLPVAVILAKQSRIVQQAC